MIDSINNFDGNSDVLVHKYINALIATNLHQNVFHELAIIIESVVVFLDKEYSDISGEEKTYIILLFLKLFRKNINVEIKKTIEKYFLFRKNEYENFSSEIVSASIFDNNDAFLDFFIKYCNLNEINTYNKKNNTIMYSKKIKEKKVMLLENIIKEYNVGDNVNGLRVNITEYILDYFDDIDTILSYKNLYITNDTTFEFENKKFSILSDEKKKIVSYQTLTIDEIIDYLEKDMFVFLYTYKFGGGDNNGEPKYMVWVEKEIKS